MRCLHIINIADLLRLDLNERKRGVDFSLNADALSSILKGVERDDGLAFVFDCKSSGELANLKYSSNYYSSQAANNDELIGLNLVALEAAFVALQAVLHGRMVDCSLYFIAMDLENSVARLAKPMLHYFMLPAPKVTDDTFLSMVLPPLMINLQLGGKLSFITPIEKLPRLNERSVCFYGSFDAGLAMRELDHLSGVNLAMLKHVELATPGPTRWDLAMKNKRVAQIICGVDDALLCQPWRVYKEEQARRFCNQFYHKLQAKVVCGLGESWFSYSTEERFKQLKVALYRLYFEEKAIDVAFLIAGLSELNTLNSPREHRQQLERWFDEELIKVLPKE